MNPAGAEPQPWTRKRWMMVVVGLFLAHLGLLFLFSEYKHSSPHKASTKTAFHLLREPLTSRQLARSFFASDPTLFSGASLHSFSGPAWLRIEFSEYSFPTDTKLPHWLDLDTNRLGQLSDTSLNRMRLPLAVTELPRPKVEPFPFFFVEERLRTQSVVRLEGALAERGPALPVALPSWPPAPELVTNSVVELAANRAGEVVSTRLIGRSGSSAADAAALQIARKLRFSGVPVSSAEDAYKVTWGTLMFDWQTLPVPDTNGIVAKP